MKELKPAILFFIIFTAICGGIYPAVVTGIARTFFPQQAAGSFITDRAGRVIGSRLIGQPFSADRYFWPRPSATAGFPYNPLASGGANAGPTNPAYLRAVAERVAALRAAGIDGPLPADLVQASASGLDPHLSPTAAAVQIPRVARARGVSVARLAQLVADRTEERRLGFLGAPRVNVLELNLELDRLSP
ncbi:potassium-transporting ATPase KdpC subunit [Geotalea uraniireducens]|uniref:Potassium-transporting ATPase KdpC subunit n=1 Tax=Geotalea uraniireducens TaxID=351604 RepID=A0ABN6VPJ9_9BACT|nr:potassium-transporting ATPase subunit KdpC [Geotalea uraniireducens]BDV41147.1 potassium-transporting ATPase KdpC subunit [Geotalea uraniireducens]